MILAVTAGKGGVGKSTVAYNLAAELDAVAIDADLGMADLPSAHGPDLHDVLAGRAAPLEAIQDLGAVSMIPCGRSLAGARATDPAALVETVEAVARRYGSVVIDTPAGMRSDAGLPVLAAEACLLVTRPTRSAIVDAVRARELARVLETPLVRVALNRVDPQRVGRETDRDRQLANTFGAPVQKIPDSETVARAQRSGQPVRTLDPSATAAEQFTALAGQVQRALS